MCNQGGAIRFVVEPCTTDEPCARQDNGPTNVSLSPISKGTISDDNDKLKFVRTPFTSHQEAPHENAQIATAHLALDRFDDCLYENYGTGRKLIYDAATSAHRKEAEDY